MAAGHLKRMAGGHLAKAISGHLVNECKAVPPVCPTDCTSCPAFLYAAPSTCVRPSPNQIMTLGRNLCVWTELACSSTLACASGLWTLTMKCAVIKKTCCTWTIAASGVCPPTGVNLTRAVSQCVQTGSSCACPTSGTCDATIQLYT
jgi:hypothetical protein